MGLSPRVRGNLPPARGPGIYDGSIPACAGEPVRRRPQCRSGRVYPRVCGGTLDVILAGLPHFGLSPRVRGNRECGVRRNVGAGSIPACAGEPLVKISEETGFEVYPRVCGGTRTPQQPGHRVHGLSPRVRGNHLIPALGAGSVWSIPACAGEPPAARRGTHPNPVYPRVCGGTPAGQRLSDMRTGLSPRVRGNQSGRCGLRRRRRSIPACAGEPGAVGAAVGAKGVYPRVCGGTAGG